MQQYGKNVPPTFVNVENVPPTFVIMKKRPSHVC